MKVHFTGRHVELTQALKTLAQERLDKMASFLDDIIDVHVILSVEKHRHLAEIQVKSSGYSAEYRAFCDELFARRSLVLVGYHPDDPDFQILLERHPEKMEMFPVAMLHGILQANDLVLEFPINIFQATVGDTVLVPTLEGQEELKIPSGTQYGQSFRIKNKGVPYLKRSGRGDLIVFAKVVVPTNLGDKQKSMMRDILSQVGPETLGDDGKGVFEKIKNAFK